MTIFELNIISTTGHPFYNVKVNEIPEGVRIALRFFDFSQEMSEEELIDPESRIELTAGLISALFEFSRAIDKKIYTLEYQSKVKVQVPANPFNNTSDTLITCSSEIYLNRSAIKQKIELIYKTLIEPKMPLITANQLLTPEKDLILRILTDDKAKNHFIAYEKEFADVANVLLEEKSAIGLEMICLCSFDFSILNLFGTRYSQEEVKNIMRQLHMIVDMSAFAFEIMRVSNDGRNLSVVIVNSSMGVTVNCLGEELFEPYYFVFICASENVSGEVVEYMTRKLNNTLRE